MLFEILKPFPYSPDGLQVVDLTAETPAMPIREDLQEGLVDGGYIKPAAGVASLSAEDLAAVEIPEAWTKLSADDLVGLAAKLGAAAKTKTAAAKVVAEEIARRVKAAAE